MPSRPNPLLRPRALIALAAAAVVLGVATPGEVSRPAGETAASRRAAREASGLVQRLADPRKSTRDAAAERLVELGPASLGALREGSASMDASIRLRCRALLDRIDGGESGAAWRRKESRALVRVLLASSSGLRAGSDDDERLAALYPESGRALAAAVRSTAHARLIRPAWARAVARHATDEGLLLLVETLADEQLPPSAALAAAEALVTAPRDGRAPVLRTSPDARRSARALLAPVLRTRAAPRRRAAVALFAALAERDDAERLVTLSGDRDRGVRLEAVRGLARLRAPGVLSTLLDRVDDPAPEVRAAALTALPPRASFGSLETVLRAAADEHPTVRAASAHLLAASATPESRAALARLRVDDSARVRAASRRASTPHANATGDSR